MAAPSSAKESAPNKERMAPTIHAAKTTETVRPSRAISAGLRKMPVPIMVPTTMAPEAQAPRPRTSSRRFSVISLRPRMHYCVALRGECAHDAADHESHNRADQEVPGKRDLRKLPNAQDSDQTNEHAYKRATCGSFAMEGAEKKETQQAAVGKRGDG